MNLPTAVCSRRSVSQQFVVNGKGLNTCCTTANISQTCVLYSFRNVCWLLELMVQKERKSAFCNKVVALMWNIHDLFKAFVFQSISTLFLTFISLWQHRIWLWLTMNVLYIYFIFAAVISFTCILSRSCLPFERFIALK